MDFTNEEFFEVINILQQRENCTVKYEIKCGKIIFSSDDNDELDLCISVLENKFIIRRVAFKNKRTGTFKLLFNYFLEYCIINKIEYIILEAIVSDAMLAFAKKNDFKPVLGKIIKDGQTLWGDYEYRICENSIN